MRWFVLILLAAGVAAADPPTGYKCGPSGRPKKDVGCVCPKDKLDARDADGKAICAPKPPPVTTACLADRTGKQAVTIDSRPDGATIYLGAKACGVVGTTPWSGRLAPGPVTVLLERQSYEPITQELVVTAKGKQDLVVTLARTNIGTIDIRADADPHVTGAAITVDGDAKGTAPVALKLAGGRHQLRIAQQGYEPFMQTLELVDQQTIVVMPVLVPAIVAKGKLVVDADVDGAEVFVDGTRRGTTPIVIELVTGPHALEVKKPPAAPFKQQVTIATGQTLVRATLAGTLPKSPTTGVLAIDSTPPGEVLLDGTSIGKTPLEITRPAGDYWLVVRAPDHADHEQRLTLVAGEKQQIVATLAKTAALEIESTPAGAAVFVDGKRAGQTPLVLALPLGDHVVIVERAGFQRYQSTVKLAAPRKLAVTLQR